MRTFDAVGFGALNCDVVSQVESVEFGDTEVASTPTLAAGGSAANTIYALARLGLDTAFMGAVGTDVYGKLIDDSFKEAGVSRDWIERKSDALTGQVIASTDGHERHLKVVPGANSFYDHYDLARATGSLLPRVRLLHLSSFVDASQRRLQSELLSDVSRELLVSCSPGQLYAEKGAARLESILARSDYVFCNEIELLTLMGYPTEEEGLRIHGRTYKEAARDYLAQFPGCRALVVTFGRGRDIFGPDPEEGRPTFQLLFSQQEGYEETIYCCEIFTGDGEWLEVEQARKANSVVDTIGAGDAFAAGFLYGVLEELDLETAAKVGDTVAKASLTAVGARAGLPDRAALDQML